VGRWEIRVLQVVGVFSKSEYHKTTIPILASFNGSMAVRVVGSISLFAFCRLILLQIIGSNNKVIWMSRAKLDTTGREV
jgi:hypothetical protein